ncbi:MAG: hypothetical protein D8H97_39910, partial [Neisseria sp.]
IKRMRAQAFGKRRIGLAGEEVGHGGFRGMGFQTASLYRKRSHDLRPCGIIVRTASVSDGLSPNRAVRPSENFYSFET